MAEAVVGQLVDLKTLRKESEFLKEKVKTLRGESENRLVSVDYKSGPNKELIDARYNRINEDLQGYVVLVDKIIESLDNAIYNYEASQAKQADVLSQNL